MLPWFSGFYHICFLLMIFCWSLQLLELMATDPIGNKICPFSLSFELSYDSIVILIFTTTHFLNTISISVVWLILCFHDLVAITAQIHVIELNSLSPHDGVLGLSLVGYHDICSGLTLRNRHSLKTLNPSVPPTIGGQ